MQSSQKIDHQHHKIIRGQESKQQITDARNFTQLNTNQQVQSSLQSQSYSKVLYMHLKNKQQKISNYLIVLFIILFIAVILFNNIAYYREISLLNTIDTSALIPPAQYYQIQNLKQFKQLPFCLFIIPSKYNQQTLLQSIKEQKYGNYKTFVVTDQQLQEGTSDKQKLNYFYYKNKMKQTCVENSVVMFVNIPLKQGALSYMNQNLQRYRAWILYVQNDHTVQVVTFYQRIYQLLQQNDFDHINRNFLQQENRRVQALSFFDLCQQSSKKLQKSKIFDSADQPTYFSIQLNRQTSFNRYKYKKIYRLSQDFKSFDYFNYEWRRKQLNKLQIPSYFGLSIQKMYRALDRQQVWYLPQNHSISQIQYIQYSAKYNINKYNDTSHQVRFCVTVMSRNNIQSDRYIKILKSIVQQQYKNYYIIFIDDMSTDTTLNSTIQYLKSVNFPKDRIKYIKNLQRNYATYNIINSAYNYCHQDDIQLLLDGDDELIGKYAFQVMNSVYQNNPNLWVVYSNYKTNQPFYGRSWRIDYDAQHIDKKTGKRKHLSFLGPIRTWRVKLIYHITIQNHKMQNGQWLDTGYDDALIHPLVELATLKRIAYVPEMMYEYNREYGANDDSNEQKVKHRLQMYQYLNGLKMLSKIDTLEGTQRNKDVWSQLKSDYNIRYTVLEMNV